MAVGLGRASAHTWPESIVPFLPCKSRHTGQISIEAGISAAQLPWLGGTGRGGAGPVSLLLLSTPPLGDALYVDPQVVSMLPAASTPSPRVKTSGVWAASYC